MQANHCESHASCVITMRKINNLKCFIAPRRTTTACRTIPTTIVVPRPIGWISSLDTDGNVNLAPYSQFNNLGYDPPYVMFSASYKNSAAVLMTASPISSDRRVRLQHGDIRASRWVARSEIMDANVIVRD